MLSVRTCFEMTTQDIHKLFSEHILIAQIEKEIIGWENSVVQESPASDSKRLKEDHDSHQAKATSLEELITCTICNERPKDVVIQCGHRLCKTCLDEFQKRSRDCPFCKKTIQNFTPCLN